MRLEDAMCFLPQPLRFAGRWLPMPGSRIQLTEGQWLRLRGISLRSSYESRITPLKYIIDNPYFEVPVDGTTLYAVEPPDKLPRFWYGDRVGARTLLPEKEDTKQYAVIDIQAYWHGGELQYRYTVMLLDGLPYCRTVKEQQLYLLNTKALPVPLNQHLPHL